MSNNFYLNFNNDNLYVGGNIVDDQWVYKYLLLKPTALDNKQIYRYDLVNNGYLPDRDSDYELIFDVFNWTNATAGNQVGLWVYCVQPSYNVSNYTTVSSISPFTFRTRLIRARTRVNYHACQGCSSIIPIINGGTQLVFWNSDTVVMHYWDIEFRGYRRLGTNT